MPPDPDAPFRGLLLAVLLLGFGISAVYRRRARRSGETIPRGREAPALIAGRLVVALPLYAGLFAYLIHPPWMRWSQVALPEWLRWAGIGLASASVPLIFWVVRSLGTNISETVLTKADHELVTTGPYRWVRHPLYTAGSLLLLGAALAAANVFLGALTVLAVAMIRLVVVPQEEARLIETFGDAYRDYRRHTGSLVPRLLPRR